MSAPQAIPLDLPDLEATHRLADALATAARAGLVVLLDGPVGAGKTTLARRIIQSLLSREGQTEDVPSPTFTIVQSYEAGALEIWHADLYRLGSTAELEELGLTTAFETAFCLVEWPDRLGQETPEALTISLDYADRDDARHASLTASGAAKEVLDTLLADNSR
jgi:tRNA threonylcarbamoyladenosine biosynthesis protein TsaE